MRMHALIISVESCLEKRSKLIDHYRLYRALGNNENCWKLFPKKDTKWKNFTPYSKFNAYNYVLFNLKIKKKTWFT